MKTIAKIYSNTIEIKRSKFMAFLVPFSQFKEQLELLKLEHPKARHFVTASRMINEFNQIVESSSDDGEPKGTSGKPTLAVLQGHDLINIAVITVRYFGGTKLGTGGLVRAYSDATNAVIESAELEEYRKKEYHNIECTYHNMGKIEYIIEKNKIEIVEKEFLQESVLIKLSCEKKLYTDLLFQCGRLLQ